MNRILASVERRGEVTRTKLPATGRVSRLPWEGVLSIATLLIAWQWASMHSAAMFFPGFGQITDAVVNMLSTSDGWTSIAITYGRILLYLLVSFLISTVVGLLATWNAHVDRFLVPLIELKQGIPAVCWVLFAVLWFSNTEIRIGFVVVTSALPAFFYQTRDALRSIPRDWIEMVQSLRPTLWQKARILWWPAVLPSLLTVWRINIGNATRVTLMAELLGGITGIGHELRVSEEMFRMDQTLAWTVVLVLFVVICNVLLSAFERRYLSYRQIDGVGHEKG